MVVALAQSLLSEENLCALLDLSNIIMHERTPCRQSDDPIVVFFLTPGLCAVSVVVTEVAARLSLDQRLGTQ